MDLTVSGAHLPKNQTVESSTTSVSQNTFPTTSAIQQTTMQVPLPPPPPPPDKTKTSTFVENLKTLTSLSNDRLALGSVAKSLSNSIEKKKEAASKTADKTEKVLSKKTNEKLKDLESNLTTVIEGTEKVLNKAQNLSKSIKLLMNSGSSVEQIKANFIKQVAAVQKSQTLPVNPDLVLQEVFSNTSVEQRAQIKARLDEYATACKIDPNQMYTSILAGKKVAEDIVNNRDWSAHPPSTQDVINLDWFLTAQQAKGNTLYLKGTLKLPDDPQHKLAAFLINARGTFHGADVGVYGRGSSHWAEDHGKIAKEPIRLPNGNWISCGQKALNTLLDVGISRKNVHQFDHPAFGIDASAASGTPPLGVSGQNSETFMVMLLQEKNLNTNQDVTMVAIKKEGHSAASITDINHGSILNRIKDFALHGRAWVEKKGPEFMRKETSTEEVSPYPDRKEDQLNPKIREELKHIQLDHPDLKESHQALVASAALGSEYRLDRLQEHLTLLKDKVEPGSREMQAITNVLNEIQSIYHQYEADSTGLSHHVRPRSNEVVLPTLSECLQDRATFH